MQHTVRILACLALLTLAGCSSYDRRFAEASRAGAKGHRIAGTYSGRWSSSQHPGAGGRLYCILSEAGGADYRAEFKATWHGIFSSTHSVVLHTTRPSGGKTRDFHGTSEIKTFIGAGVYRCRGTLDGDRIGADYDATYDRGSFEVKRVR